MNNNPILWFSEEACKEVRLAGGKGASLASMTAERLPVPPGFVVPAYVLEQSVDVERLRALAQAQDDANKLIARAQEEAEEAVHREGLLRLADEKAEQIKVEADAYVVETLRALRDHLTSIEMDIDRSILSIEKGLASLELPDAEGEEDVYEEVGNGQPNVSSPVKTKPRSASLAVDTMGGPVYQQDSMQKKE